MVQSSCMTYEQSSVPRRRLPDLPIVAVVAAVEAGAAASPALPWWVRLAVTFPLVTFLPGYALVRALIPRRATGLVETFTLAIGLSLSIAALGGIVLDFAAPGLVTNTWVSLLFAITIGGTIVAALRAPSPNEPENVLAVVRGWRSADPSPPQPTIGKLSVLAQSLAFTVAVAIVIGAFGVAVWGADHQPRPGFSELWLSPTSDPEEVTVGIRNDEHAAIEVSLVLTLGSSVEGRWPVISLSDGQSWTATAHVPGFFASSVPLDAVLTRIGSSEPYRQVSLWPG